MTITATHTPTKLETSENREAWLERRRYGITATEVAKLAGKYGARERRRFQIEKIEGVHLDLTGNRYVERGNIREPFISAWIFENFDLDHNAHLYAGENPRDLATPDGVSATFDEDRITAEVKTSKHDLNPLAALGDWRPGGVVTPEIYWSGGHEGHFWDTDYYDQCQWQMHVMGGDRVLFVWEQHDDAWPNPTPLRAQPSWCWILRDQKRIDQLIEIADREYAEVERIRGEGGLAPAGDIPGELAQLMHELLADRDAEAVAKAKREGTWAKIQAYVADKPEFALENEEASISWNPAKLGKAAPKTTVNYDGMKKKAPKLVENYEALKKRYTSTELVDPEPKATLNVSAKKPTK